MIGEIHRAKAVESVVESVAKCLFSWVVTRMHLHK